MLTLCVRGCSVYRDTVTVAVLAIFPTLVTTPFSDIGGIVAFEVQYAEYVVPTFERMCMVRVRIKQNSPSQAPCGVLRSGIVITPTAHEKLENTASRAATLGSLSSS